MNIAQDIETGTPVITEKEKRNALARILDREELAGAERLRAFLTYIVEEEVAGRGEAILGKTIAQDVYGRTLSEKGDVDNIVRVDARRLRQHLDLYYERDGQDDPVRIFLDTGGYCPRFEMNAQTKASSEGKAGVKRIAPYLLFIGGVGAGVIITFLALKPSIEPEKQGGSALNVGSDEGPARLAIMEKSASSLQAVNLAEQARNMIFPIFDRARQELIGSVFQRVIEIDPDYYGGYAGLAQTAATLAITMPPGAKRDEYVTLATKSAQRALKLDPSQAWTQSAMAWVEFANRNYNRALRLSNRAVELASDDGHVLDFHGAITLFSGEFAEALKVSNRDHLTLGANRRFANRNIRGAASLHLGDFKTTVESFDAAAKMGDPLSAPSIAFTAVALAKTGRQQEAREKIAELERSWPKARIADMLYGIYRDRAHADQVLVPLAELGWRQPD